MSHGPNDEHDVIEARLYAGSLEDRIRELESALAAERERCDALTEAAEESLLELTRGPVRRRLIAAMNAVSTARLKERACVSPSPSETKPT